jgi:predicted  nucleic acid-binding Zn-ribbon protein
MIEGRSVMAMTLQDQLKALAGIQEIDLNIDSIRKKKNGLPVVLQSLDQQMNLLQTQIAERSKKISDIEALLRQTKAAADLNQDRHTRTNQRLEGVENTKEFSALNTELQQIQKLKIQLDETKLKSEAEIEVLKKESAELQAKHDALKAERDSKAAEVATAGSGMETDLQSLVTTRQDRAQGVEKRMIARYDLIRSKKNGVGIVPAASGRCMGCNRALPPQMYNLLKRGQEMMECPACHRILFVSET